MVKPKYLEPGAFILAALTLAGGAALSTKSRAGEGAVSSHAVYAWHHLGSANAGGGLLLRRDGGLLRGGARLGRRLEGYPARFSWERVPIMFCVFWLPVLVAGGFVQDDWLLLAAASVRHVVVVHPATSWLALDSVDGNFRPLARCFMSATCTSCSGWLRGCSCWETFC